MINTIFFDSLITTSRVLFWSLLAWILGIMFGILFRNHQLLYRIGIYPINFIKQISPFAWLPLAIILFGLGEWSVGFVLLISMIFPSMIMTVELFRHLPQSILEEAKSAGAHGWYLLFHIELPLSMKGLITHYRLLWSIGWNTVIAAEMLGVSQGLGYRILDFRYLLAYRSMIIYIIIIGMIGIISDKIIKSVARKYFSYEIV